MSRTPRLFAFAVLAGLALMATGCESKNKGIIVGKWKVTTVPEKDAKTKSEFEQLSKLGVFMYIEFKADDTMVLGLDADNPQFMEMIKAGAPGGKVSFPAKYRLKSGNQVEIYDIKDKELKDMLKGDDKARSDIMIEGDNMTIKDPDGSTTKLVRMKDAPAGGGAGAAPPEKKAN